jgi:hypothetical protein
VISFSSEETCPTTVLQGDFWISCPKCFFCCFYCCFFIMDEVTVDGYNFTKIPRMDGQGDLYICVMAEFSIRGWKA